MKDSSTSTIAKLYNRYLVDALGALAYGLFASVIIGVVLKQLFAALAYLTPIFAPLATVIADATVASSPVVGAIIGVAVGYGLKSKPLAMYSAGVAGAIGYSVVVGDVAAGPVGAFLAAIIAAECGNWVSGKTPIDIVLVPLAAIIAGAIAGLVVGAPIAQFMMWLGALINTFATLHPWIAGPAIALVVGLALSGPISSAALAIMLGLSGAAAGAATAGCCAHMIGFALISFGDNGVGGLLAQGLGTSKIQLPNIMKHPVILIPPVIASLVGGFVGTVVFSITNTPIGAGMGTCGMIGPIVAWGDMIAQGQSPASVALALGVTLFVLPAVLSLSIDFGLRKLGYIQKGFMTLQKH